MTKTYNDIEAVTCLLEEKESDLEIAARIGQSLLEKNQELVSRNQCLEEEIISANEKVSQLKHEIGLKDGLLNFYTNNLEEDGHQTNIHPHTTNFDLTMVGIENLQDKLKRIELENRSLRSRSANLEFETGLLEEKEQKLVKDCVQQLRDANDQAKVLTDELDKQSEKYFQQKDEISYLHEKAFALEEKVKKVLEENVRLQCQISAAHDSQRILTEEVSELRKKYDECVELLHEANEEIKSVRRMDRPRATRYAYTPYSPTDSLASELEDSFRNELRCSELIRRIGGEPGTCVMETSMSKDGAISALSGSGNTFRLPEKLKIIKPIEGSMTLYQWQRLATPHLGVLLDEHPGVQIKGEKKIDLFEEYDLNDFEEDDEYYPGKCSEGTLMTYTYTDATIFHSGKIANSDNTVVTSCFSSPRAAIDQHATVGLHSSLSATNSNQAAVVSGNQMSDGPSVTDCVGNDVTKGRFYSKVNHKKYDKEVSCLETTIAFIPTYGINAKDKYMETFSLDLTDKIKNLSAREFLIRGTDIFVPHLKAIDSESDLDCYMVKSSYQNLVSAENFASADRTTCVPTTQPNTSNEISGILEPSVRIEHVHVRSGPNFGVMGTLPSLHRINTLTGNPNSEKCRSDV
ncbi:trafficking kinesin-binding protein 1-like [Tubulanus polymorphus]|uniref:trafficking kinesin-binding protein 1-like n=1 Tax=Tubulanus polymorphus TaxID=672921 RepID=UPI003DA61627